MTMFAVVDLPPVDITHDHPAWCSPARCTVLPDLPADEGVHLSTAVTLDAPLTVTGALVVQAWLQQIPGGDTYLVLDAPDIDCGRVLYPVAEDATSVAALQHLLLSASA